MWRHKYTVFWNKKNVLKYLNTNQQAYVELRLKFLYTKQQIKYKLNI